MQHHAPLIKTPVKSRKDTSRAPSAPVITQSLTMIRADIKDKMEWLHQNIISGSGFVTHKECDFHLLTFHSGLLTAPQERQHQHRRAKKKTNKTTVKGSVSLSVWSVIRLLSASPTEQPPRTRGFATHRKAARDASHRCPCCAQRPGATAAPPSTPRHRGRSLPTCSATRVPVPHLTSRQKSMLKEGSLHEGFESISPAFLVFLPFPNPS